MNKYKVSDPYHIQVTWGPVPRFILFCPHAWEFQREALCEQRSVRGDPLTEWKRVFRRDFPDSDNNQLEIHQLNPKCQIHIQKSPSPDIEQLSLEAAIHKWKCENMIY